MDPRPSEELNHWETNENENMNTAQSYPGQNDPFVQELLANPSTPLDTDKVIRLLDTIITSDNLFSGFISNVTKSIDGALALHLSSLQSFPLLQTLNISEEALVKALKNSKYTYDEETKVINFKLARKTVILLNAPGDTTADEIKQFFGDLSSEISDTKLDIENAWFITFTTEDNAINAVINCSGKRLKENKVNVRIKSESTLKILQNSSAPWVSENVYLPEEQYQYQFYDGSFPSYSGPYQGEYYYDQKPSYRHNPNSRFRGRGGRKYGGSRNDQKDTSVTPLQIMGNGEIVYGKKVPFNKGQSNNYRGKGSSTKRVDKRSGHQAPPLGVAHFPPLGANSKNIKKISRDEILLLHDKALDVSKDIKESPIVSNELVNDLSSTVQLEGDLKQDILDAKWWDGNQKRSKSTQRKRPKSNASENKPLTTLITDQQSTSRSSSVGKKRSEVIESESKTEEENPTPSSINGDQETSHSIEEVQETPKTSESETNTKPKWADIARSRNQQDAN